MRTALRKARNDKGLEVAGIAGKLGVSTSFYYKIEQGARNPTIELAKQIADLLGSTVDDLFFAEELDDSSNSPTGTAG